MPFFYPKSKHYRTQTPKNYKDYHKYKPFLKIEFENKCIYCRKPSTISKDDSDFGVEHYFPKSSHPHLECNYENLFYCCNGCNNRKRAWIPLNKKGELFIPNPCDYVMFDHLKFVDEVINAKSDSGKFTIDYLDLNDNEFLEFRKSILTMIKVIEEKLISSKALLKDLKKQETSTKNKSQRAIQEAYSETLELIKDHEKNLNRLKGITL